MAERTTRFDSMVEQEEKINPFKRATQNLRRASDNRTPDVEDSSETQNDEVADEVAQGSVETELEKAQSEPKDSAAGKLDISDIVDAAKRTKKKGGRSRTFYMKDSTHEKLVSVAEKQGIATSQLLNIILDNVLNKM